ncbi:MAG: SDR family oxidoreductase [Candidatus Daviesbacteria bacterium]|nr:SDR family oxidoreductase [Candidatus Daviesbacteria bacterium]
MLILGKGGMLGSMVFDYFSQDDAYEVKGTEKEEFNADEFLKDNSKFSYIKDFDYLINCIGIIKPFCKDDDSEGVLKAIRINALFPHELAKFCEKSYAKIIQIATDCVFSGKFGNYDETSQHDPVDVYGKSKSLGEVYFGSFLNIRCSIVGPEMKNNLGLLGWFLTQKKGTKLKGFINHKWNGVTTLQFAILCKRIIDSNKFDQLIKISRIFHFVPNNIVTKYDLLSLFNKVFEIGTKIERVETKEIKDMTLKTRYSLEDLFGNSSIEKSLSELKDYMNNSTIFKY